MLSLTRWRAAWSVLRGRCIAIPAPEWTKGKPRPTAEPMGTAVAIITEALRPDGPDATVVNRLLVDVPPKDIGTVITAIAVLAAMFGRSLAVHDADGPTELLRYIALAAADRGE